MITKLRTLITTGGPGMLMLTMLVVNGGNYLINLLLGRVLGPEAFAEAGVLATAVLMLSFVAIGFQMTAAKYAAYFSNNQEQLTAFNQWITRSALYAGMGLALILALVSLPLQAFLHFRTLAPFLLIAAIIPVYFQMSAGRGLLQGQLQFKKLALSYLLEMIGRVMLTGLLIGALLLLGTTRGSTEIVALSFGVAFWVAGTVTPSKPRRTTLNFALKERAQVINFMLIMGAYELTQILISHSDVMLVKHYFTNQEAGLYTALALIGRIVFFATWAVVTMLLPRVVQAEKEGMPHLHLFHRALLWVCVAGVSITLGCYLFDELIITLLFGKAYLPVSHLLWLYAGTTTLFACANVFAYYYLSLSKYTPVIFSALAGLLQIGLVFLFHDTLQVVIQAQFVTMGLLFIGMLIFHTIKNYQNEKSTYRAGFTLSAE
ncbi:MAG: sugar isomerase [Lewinellaceae bacterium]|nr:sugar isomerase [Lewinellaceae bacterium]